MSQVTKNDIECFTDLLNEERKSLGLRTSRSDDRSVEAMIQAAKRFIDSQEPRQGPSPAPVYAHPANVLPGVGGTIYNVEVYKDGDSFDTFYVDSLYRLNDRNWAVPLNGDSALSGRTFTASYFRTFELENGARYGRGRRGWALMEEQE